VSDGDRVFLRGLTSAQYGLGEQRREQLAAPRVIRAGTVTDDAKVGHSGDSDEGMSRTWWMLGPGDDPFRTQTLHVHFVELLPGGSNHVMPPRRFYVLRRATRSTMACATTGRKATSDHFSGVHRHYNAADQPRAHPRHQGQAAWMYLGRSSRGAASRSTVRGSGSADGAAFRYDAPKRKVVKRSDTKWDDTRDGHPRHQLAGAHRRAVLRGRPVRAGDRAGFIVKRWHIADEVCCVLGKGHSLHWEVETRSPGITTPGSRRSRPPRFRGDVLYVPQNTVRQHVADDDERSACWWRRTVFQAPQLRQRRVLADAVAGGTPAAAARPRPSSALDYPLTLRFRVRAIGPESKPPMRAAGGDVREAERSA
jgi:hypothetical protein